jgi:hypothetical protein
MTIILMVADPVNVPRILPPSSEKFREPDLGDYLKIYKEG